MVMILKNGICEVRIERGIIRRAGEIVKGLEPFKVCIITDKNVSKQWLPKILSSMDSSRVETEVIELEPGEQSKGLETVESIWTFLIENGFTRKSLLIGLGGGVICDLTGFAASTFMRGVDFVLIPTTLLSQVDASIGGKTGIDFEGKNIIGTFHQPKMVLTDPEILTTLERGETVNGIAELIKYGIIWDEKLFSFLEENLRGLISLKNNVADRAIESGAKIKMEVVERDEKERGLRRILNFGHTIGHALELLSDYKITHGEAVALGMIAECAVAERVTGFGREGRERVDKIVRKIGINPEIRFQPEDVIRAIKRDKKACRGRNVFVLPKKIGDVEIKEVGDEEIIESLRRMNR